MPRITQKLRIKPQDTQIRKKIHPKMLFTDFVSCNSTDTIKGFHWVEANQDQSSDQEQQPQNFTPQS